MRRDDLLKAESCEQPFGFSLAMPVIEHFGEITGAPHRSHALLSGIFTYIVIKETVLPIR